MKYQTEIKIRNWIIFTKFGVNSIPYILNANKLNVNEDELALCIEEQLFKK